jgi:hypothetical protein
MKSVHNISVEDNVNRIQGFFTSDMDGEKVLLNVETGKYYNLGQIGGQIWDLIEIKYSVQRLVETLTNDFIVEQDICQMQVLEFLESLYNEGLIEIH